MSYRSPVAEFRAFLALIVLAGALAAAPVSAQDQAVFVDPSDYLQMYDDADLRGVEQPDDAIYDAFVEITGNAAVDERIREAAEARGYVRRPIATVGLVSVDGRELQAPAAEAWTAMKAVAGAEGISLMLTSAHRDLAEQRALFRGRLGGATSDAAIDAALRTSAPPGYSKHHSGYAIDVGQAGALDVGFVNTAAYRWLSERDFARAKLFGFIPSYPSGGEDMGPDPEAWEFVWIGPGRVACAIGDDSTDGFCDLAGHPRVDDVGWMADRGVTVGCAPGRFCPDDAITRGEAASLLWRLHGAPVPAGPAPFVDVYPADHFGPAVAWLWENELVSGTSSVTFSPDEFLRPAEAWALALRLVAWDQRPAPLGLFEPGADTEGVGAAPAEPSLVGDFGDHIDRAEFASMLRAVAES